MVGTNVKSVKTNTLPITNTIGFGYLKNNTRMENLSREQAIEMGKAIAEQLAKENKLVIELAKRWDLRIDVEDIQKRYTQEDLKKILAKVK